MPVDTQHWEIISGDSGGVSLDGMIAVDVLINVGDPETEMRPLLVAIESNAGLTGQWEVVVDGVPSNGQTTSITVPAVGQAMFYRVRQE